MRFGHFCYPMNFDASRDLQVIEDCLKEAQLVEELGWDAIWFAEHNFTGEVVYADPLMFASAVAVKTSRILLGFGVVEMALHHPVRLAIQTSVLDNISRGRLIVGTGRGSNLNAFEYAGFGTTVSEGHERLEEAEDLLIKAWTTENLRYEGEYWQVAFPAVRPRPYQKPHPPLARACISEESIRAMAKIGRPVMLRGRPASAEGWARVSGCIGTPCYQQVSTSRRWKERWTSRGSGERHMWPRPTTKLWKSSCRLIRLPMSTSTVSERSGTRSTSPCVNRPLLFLAPPTREHRFPLATSS